MIFIVLCKQSEHTFKIYYWHFLKIFCHCHHTNKTKQNGPEEYHLSSYLGGRTGSWGETGFFRAQPYAHEGTSRSSWTVSITKCTLTFVISCCPLQNSFPLSSCSWILETTWKQCSCSCNFTPGNKKKLQGAKSCKEGGWGSQPCY